MAAAAVATTTTPLLVRKRCATPFLDEPPLLTKHVRFSPSPAITANNRRPSLELNPLDVLRRIFPDADPGDLESAFHASGRNVHATVSAVRARQAKDEAEARFSRAAAATDGGMEECAGILVEQMAGAADVPDAKVRASWILALFKNAVGSPLSEENAALKAQAAASSTEAASLKEENGSLRARAASSLAEMAKLREENAALRTQAAALERDNTVLKRGVVLLQTRKEAETEERAASSEMMKKKIAELEMANYALTIRLRDADTCHFQHAFRDGF